MFTIAIMYRADMALTASFRRVLITLISFDIGCVTFNSLVFSLPKISDRYLAYVFPYVTPVILPLAQIVLTGKLKYCLTSANGFNTPMGRPIEEWLPIPFALATVEALCRPGLDRAPGKSYR